MVSHNTWVPLRTADQMASRVRLIRAISDAIYGMLVAKRLCKLSIGAAATRKVVVMFIHEMSPGECREALERTQVGHLACARDNQPYVLPLNFTIDGHYLYLYGFTTLGQKVEWMRSNPLVCFEIDDVVNHSHWMSVIVFGRYEELPDDPAFAEERERAFSHLQKRVMWWEPAYASREHKEKREQPYSPVFFRIKIDKMTGHYAVPDREARQD